LEKLLIRHISPDTLYPQKKDIQKIKFYWQYYSDSFSSGFIGLFVLDFCDQQKCGNLGRMLACESNQQCLGTMRFHLPLVGVAW